MKELKALIRVKTLITLPVVFALIYGFVVDKIDAQQFMMIVALVIGFYFTKKDEPT